MTDTHDHYPGRFFTEQPVLDIEIFNDLLSILEDDFYKLLNEFIEGTPNILNNLSKAISEHNFDKVFALSHSIKGSSGNLGMNKLSALLGHIENCAKANCSDHCMQLDKEIKMAFDEVKAELIQKMKVL